MQQSVVFRLPNLASLAFLPFGAYIPSDLRSTLPTR